MHANDGHLGADGPVSDCSGPLFVSMLMTGIFRQDNGSGRINGPLASGNGPFDDFSGQTKTLQKLRHIKVQE